MNQKEIQSNSEGTPKKKSKIPLIVMTVVITIITVIVFLVIMNQVSKAAMEPYFEKARVLKATVDIEHASDEVLAVLVTDPAAKVSSKQEVLDILSRGYGGDLVPLENGVKNYFGYKEGGKYTKHKFALCPGKSQPPITAGDEDITVTCNGIVPEFENVDDSFSLN